MRMEVNITLISVLLTIIGYSINNSIIVFDRVRENMGTKNGHLSEAEYKELVNTSIDETIWMALDGSITTIIPVIFLLIMGSSAIATFNVAYVCRLSCWYILFHLHRSVCLGLDQNPSCT